MRYISSITIILIISLKSFAQEVDEYVNECYDNCQVSKNLYDCVKYYVIKFVSDLNFGSAQEKQLNSTRVNINRRDTTLTYKQSDNDFIKLYKFLRRKIDDFFDDDGWNYVFPEEVFSSKRALITDEYFDEGNYIIPRSKKERYLFFIPIILITKLMKISVLLGMIYTNLFVAKAVLLVIAFAIPRLARNLARLCLRRKSGLLSNLFG
ncbi:unnamed protein product [Phyllotreta striolata]|uniref:Uncharacterized protein n=1 Tax=Phyllotreta striolata TaxID=444603 RepID=A0A9N9XSM0_PHYSR|nr:unnamed protein product [Phyllotreta striolata]